MKDFFELTTIDSKLDYIKISAPSIYEMIQSDLQENPNNNKLIKEFTAEEGVLAAFYHSGNDAIITTKDNPYSIKKCLTKKSTVRINGKYTFIGDNCFSECASLKTVIFEEGVKHIYKRAVRGNPLIESIVFPKSLELIDDEAFIDCNNLSDVTFLNPETLISQSAFKGTKWFEDMTEDFVVINGQLLKYNGHNENVIIPEGVRRIAGEVFENNKAIKTVICPSTLEEIWTFAFAGCTNLQKVTFNDGLENISIGAFDRCTGIKEVTLPPTLNNIGLMAFDNNTLINFHDTKPELTEFIKEIFPLYTVIG